MATEVVAGFIGAMDNRPNFESARWLLCELAPLLVAGGFKGKLLLAGRDPPRLLRRLGAKYPFVEFTGFISSLDGFWSSLSYLVAPHVVGSGVRTKILEGIASGVPVLTNTNGAGGLSDGVRASPFLICRDRAIDWAEQLLNESEPYKMRKYLEREPTCRELIAELVYADVA